MLCAGFLQFRYDSRIDYASERNVFFVLPSGQTLKILSFGYQNLISDMLYIWSIQFYASTTLTNRYDYIEHIFNIITDLSPKYKDPYLMGSLIMALEFRDVKMAIRLLQKGAKNIKDDYIFDFESGYYMYKILKDYKQAEKYFKSASEKPDAPPFIKRYFAHMIYMRDNLAEAYNLWMDIYKNATQTIEKNYALLHLYQIKYEVDKKRLEERINQYKLVFGKFPFNLNELKRKGFINMVPKDFRRNDYIYDQKTGKIKAKRILKWKKLF